MSTARSMTSELGGALETIRIFHQLWYGTDLPNPICTYPWALVLAYHYQMKKEAEDGIKKRGFSFSAWRLRRDGSLAPPIKDSYIPGDPAIARIIGQLFGYD